MKQPVVGRGDLIRSLAARQLSDQAVALLGFEPSPPSPGPGAAQDQDQRRGAAGGHADHAQAGSSTPPATQFKPLPTLFWRLERLEVADDQSEAKSNEESDRSREVQVARETSRPASRGEDDSTTRPLELLPLATSAELRSRVRHLSALRGASDELDIPAAVERIARETVVFDLPRRQHVTLGRLHVVEDRAEHLIPYWLDQDLTTDLLRTFYPADDLCVARIEPGRLEPAVRWPRSQAHRAGWPEPGVTLLVLGDLGCLNNATDYWLQVGRRMRKQGSAAIALVPCRREEVPDDVWRWWQVIPWESSPAGASSETPLDAAQLAALLALTIRLEPGLLRSVRRALPGGAGNPGLESRVWSDRAIASPHPLGATWNSEQLKPLRQIADSVPSQYLALIWSEIDRWHGRLSKSIGHAEVLALDCVNPEVCRSVVGDGRRREAVSYVQAAARAHGGLSEER
ncbi:MAG: hypothetical protein J5I93_06870, partial [Pirellulaceae bacterium]|nr:hypothetical protein [Pirellulaceae bacterium]